MLLFRSLLPSRHGYIVSLKLPMALILEVEGEFSECEAEYACTCRVFACAEVFERTSTSSGDSCVRIYPLVTLLTPRMASDKLSPGVHLLSISAAAEELWCMMGLRSTCLYPPL